MPSRILVIEDEPGIVDFLERGLRSYGFDVESALDGVAGAQRAVDEAFDLVVLDLMLPLRGGLEVLKEVHEAKPALPVVVLTARGEVEDRVAGLDAGAIDYLTKPFSLTELAARIRAQLRSAAQAPTTMLSGGDVEVDLITREVRRGGEVVRLSTTEFELLSYLLRNTGRVLSREQILRAVWGYEYDPGTNVVDVYVGYLRRKLRRSGDRDPIVTVRSVGYRFDAPT
ncbi:MAG: two-component system, OmpR family, response regulator [Solirubrobacteraceae bacterium]|jgi:DNA-binding response OmpR family regulator|nr:two-component system, OmpR family, response regulator [Solirubrobacteraceae bacterium]